jgi:hypothetical protein
MKKLMALVATVALVAWADLSLRATDTPHGDLLELHSCQPYTGGCDANGSDGAHPLLIDPCLSVENRRYISY